MVTEIYLGALMEIADDQLPAVTIECGGAHQPEAHRIAYQGLCRYMENDQILSVEYAIDDVELFQHPIRLELKVDCNIAYSKEPLAGADITVRPDIEHFNFTLVHRNTRLGWLGGSGFEQLSAVNHLGANVTRDYFEDRAGALYPRHPLKIFMATTRADIAMSDCLFYAVAVDID